MRILVTGATGFIGVPLCMGLLQRGHNVCGLVRDTAHAASLLPSSVFLQQWHGEFSDKFIEAVVTSDIIIHLAGESLADTRWTPEVKRRIVNSRVESTNFLVEAMRQAGSRPRSFLSGSATGFYGYRGDTEITEATERGTGFLADLCEAWEQAANAASDLGIRVVNLRTGIVLGEGGALKKMLYPLPFGVSPFKLGLGGSLGTGKQWVPWIHIQDAVNLILFSLENETITGPINLTSPNPVTNRELTTALGKQLHRPIFFSVPASLLRLATGEIANDLLSSQRVLPSKAIESGFSFQFSSINDALRDIVQTM